MENEVIITLSKSDFLRLKRTLFKMLKDEFLQCVNSIIEEAVYHVLGKYYNLPLTVDQVASLIGKNPKAVYKMCDRQQIPFTKVGKKTFINIKDINLKLILVDNQNES